MSPGAHTTARDCRGCGASLHAAAELLDMEPMPLAGQFCATPQEAASAAVYPLTLLVCPRCSLVQVQQDVSDELLYSRYNYASSSIPSLVEHFARYAVWLIEKLGQPRARVLEIGCNDGVLLRQLPEAWHRLGVDPSDVASSAADPSYALVSRPFSDSLAQELDGAGTYDLVTGSNCLAHISDLRDVFTGAHRMLRAGGLFVVEVHDLGATLQLGQWDTVYHEHKVEWSQRSLDNCLLPLGFEHVETSRLPLHGGLLRAVFRKAAPRPGPGPQFPEGGALLRRAYEGRRTTQTYRRILRALEKGERVVAYGAAGRANVWFNQHRELAFEYVVDDAPLRAGRFIPRLAFPIHPSPELARRPPHLCVITAWNYAAEIRAKHGEVPFRWEQSLGGD